MEDETAYSYHEDKVHEVDAQQARVMGLVTANVLLQLMAILMLMMQLQLAQENGCRIRQCICDHVHGGSKSM